jgi:predicted nucleic acid-binding protein
VGLILDSSVLIAAERGAQPISELLAGVRASAGVTDVMLSAVSVIELEHGYWRAAAPEIARKRRTYLDEVLAAVPVQPFTLEMAQLAAKVDASARKEGVTIPFADLEIGATALHFGYAVGTANVRHFQMIPGLTVVSL